MFQCHFRLNEINVRSLKTYYQLIVKWLPNWCSGFPYLLSVLSCIYCSYLSQNWIGGRFKYNYLYGDEYSFYVSKALLTSLSQWEHIQHNFAKHQSQTVFPPPSETSFKYITLGNSLWWAKRFIWSIRNLSEAKWNDVTISNTY